MKTKSIFVGATVLYITGGIFGIFGFFSNYHVKSIQEQTTIPAAVEIDNIYYHGTSNSQVRVRTIMKNQKAIQSCDDFILEEKGFTTQSVQGADGLTPTTNMGFDFCNYTKSQYSILRDQIVATAPEFRPLGLDNRYMGGCTFQYAMESYAAKFASIACNNPALTIRDVDFTIAEQFVNTLENGSTSWGGGAAKEQDKLVEKATQAKVCIEATGPGSEAYKNEKLAILKNMPKNPYPKLTTSSSPIDCISGISEIQQGVMDHISNYGYVDYPQGMLLSYGNSPVAGADISPLVDVYYNIKTLQMDKSDPEVLSPFTQHAKYQTHLQQNNVTLANNEKDMIGYKWYLNDVKRGRNPIDAFIANTTMQLQQLQSGGAPINTNTQTKKDTLINDNQNTVSLPQKTEQKTILPTQEQKIPTYIYGGEFTTPSPSTTPIYEYQQTMPTPTTVQGRAIQQPESPLAPSTSTRTLRR